MKFLKTVLVLFSLILSVFVVQSVVADELVIIYRDGSRQVVPFAYPYNQVVRFEVKTPYGTITSSSKSHTQYYYRYHKASVQYSRSGIPAKKTVVKRGLRVCNASPQDGDIIDPTQKCK